MLLCFFAGSLFYKWWTHNVAAKTMLLAWWLFGWLMMIVWWCWMHAVESWTLAIAQNVELGWCLFLIEFPAYPLFYWLGANQNISSLGLETQRFAKWSAYLHYRHPLTCVDHLCLVVCSYFTHNFIHLPHLISHSFLFQKLWNFFFTCSWMCPLFNHDF